MVGDPPGAECARGGKCGRARAVEEDAVTRRRWMMRAAFVVLGVCFFWPLWFNPDGFLYRPNSTVSDLTVTHWPNARFVRDALATWGQVPVSYTHLRAHET